MATDAQIMANRINAQHSTGPKTAEGKERSKRNALTHGLTATVVIPGEVEGEVAFRVALAQESLAKDDDGFALLMAERAGYLFMRLKRCYQYEEAMTARRVRDAEADFDNERRSAVEHILSYIANEPPTGSRQLRETPEGVDLLIDWMRELQTQVDHRWGEYHCYKFDEAIGSRSMENPYSRMRALTELATKGDASNLEPGEAETLPPDAKAWALAQIARLIAAELANLQAHRATLDHARFDANRAQAKRRALHGVDKETALFKKYEAAAERALSKTIAEIKAYRREQRLSLAEERRAVRVHTDCDHGDEANERQHSAIFKTGSAPAGAAKSGSFVPPGDRPTEPMDASTFTIGKAPNSSFKPAKPPRYTP